MKPDILQEHVLSIFKLTDNQRLAAKTRSCDIAVTAGAGSGKTSTLVARYTSLLADGHPLRSVVAITFTEKAALEMRSRVRESIQKLISQSDNDKERQFWIGLNAQLDSARIGTIHSLCMEILRAHPVEARIDPKFSVIDEADTTTLKFQLVDDTLAELVNLAEYRDIFRILSTTALKDLLQLLITKRLETAEAIEKSTDVFQPLKDALQVALSHPDIACPINDFREMSEAQLSQDAGDKLASQIITLRSVWDEVEMYLMQSDIVKCAIKLYDARRNWMGLRAGKRNSETYQDLKTLQGAYDLLIDPICGGKDAKEDPPSRENEELFLHATDLVKKAFNYLLDKYKNALQAQGALDFDDLENGAVQVLKIHAVQQLWHDQISSLLVDEFQDTNERQRQIVASLANIPGKLFIVGDAKQSIYRFRSADVTVFRKVQEDIKAQDGLHIDLDENFRTHAELLDGMGELLEIVMQPDSGQPAPYFVSYEAMHAYHQDASSHIQSPFLEFVLGTGEKTADGRVNAARALANRLVQLKLEGEINAWDDVTLLFRATRGFADYENALEEVDIPFVTVSGRGFYDRPEIRDVLNILRALSDPSDDLAMAGLLRSPAFGLSDAALYQLRWQDETLLHYWNVLQGDLSALNPTDKEQAQRTITILQSLFPFVDRIPVAELLKKLVDATDYRAILAIGSERGSGGRLWRNLDKLIADARDSRKVIIRDFLDYVATINDAGVREGEAPSEAQGAVRLMTIHKSKGLEFPIVVLADASRESRPGKDPAILSTDMGLAIKLDPPTMLFKLAKSLDKEQDEAESLRILYVALTRTKQKLIISGHSTSTQKSGWSTKGWMKALVSAVDLDLNDLVQHAGEPVEIPTPKERSIRAFASQPISQFSHSNPQVPLPQAPESDEQPLYAPLEVPKEQLLDDDSETLPSTWHTTVSNQDISQPVIGKMVHKAIEMWCFPGDSRLNYFMETVANKEGSFQRSQMEVAFEKATNLLNRLRNHPIYTEIQNASERYHEIPYTWKDGPRSRIGYIDILYLSSEGWQILDFKSDIIESQEQLDELVEKYQGQMNKYTKAVTHLLNTRPTVRICFLDDREKVTLR